MAFPTFATFFWGSRSMAVGSRPRSYHNAWVSQVCTRDLRRLYKTEWLGSQSWIRITCLPDAIAEKPPQKQSVKGGVKAACGDPSQTSFLKTSYPPIQRDTLNDEEESPDSCCGKVRVRGVLFGVRKPSVRCSIAFKEMCQAMSKYEGRVACTFLPKLGHHYSCEEIA